MRRAARLTSVVLFGIALLGGFPLAISSAEPKPKETKVDFNRDVRPILAGKCYACHGPDKNERKAKLRFDDRDVALAWKRAKRRAIVPGDAAASSLVHRITTDDEDDRMPPVDSGKKLSAAEIDTLVRWIQQGAEWSEHWAYVRPKRHAAPDVPEGSLVRNDIDRFILARLAKEGLSPASEADRVTLLRRLSFDLNGLPPSSAEIDAFLADTAAGAFERQVGRLLSSPHYGERMAIYWLDLVRFADTRGYHSDNPRNVAPFRDYVVRSFNGNLRFDQFTIEQLAGDLLPEPTVWQRVATCYTKLNQTTEEGGAQPKEYEAMNAADRVRNVSVVFMGATIGCAQCHEHKFDPYPTKDFYSMGAFFADIQESSIGDRDKGIPVPTLEQDEFYAEVEKKIAALRREIENPPKLLAAVIANSQRVWESTLDGAKPPRIGPWHAIGPFGAGDANKAFLEAFPPEKEIDLAKKYEGGKLAWKKRKDFVDGKVHTLTGSNCATYLYRAIESDTAGTLAVSIGSDDGVHIWVNGQSVLSKNVSRGVVPDQDKATLPLKAGKNAVLMKITNGGGGYGFYFRPLSKDGIPSDIRAILAKGEEARTADEKKKVAAHYATIAPQLAEKRAELATANTRRSAIEKGFPYSLVAKSGNPRTVRILPRGNWLDESGEVVEPAIPSYFGVLETGGKRASRLDLAKWFVSKDNPLTARVFVNRLWKLFFGIGISKRLDDIGAMGEPPVHAELLDWLAVEFVESGWDVKHMVKLLVTSATYRQVSVTSDAYVERDPYNRLLARQSRWRHDAEVVRDNVLAISGLLSRRIGGSSVRPYQPGGYWMHLNFPKRRWTADKGENGYRRGLYTWWQRSFLHPSLMAFDAPNREECTVERPRSNIPQQALVLLNDPTYVESARVFATRVVKEGGTEPSARIRWAFREATSRTPDDGEVQILLSLYEKHRASYAASTDSAALLLKTGQAPAPTGSEQVELAAWTSVARAILNLHETVTRN
jgi:mono/diheme cytochrome c family protein